MVSEDFRKIGTNHYTAPKALSYIYIYSLDTDTPINHLDHHAHHSCTGLGSGRVGYKAKWLYKRRTVQLDWQLIKIALVIIIVISCAHQQKTPSSSSPSSTNPHHHLSWSRRCTPLFWKLNQCSVLSKPKSYRNLLGMPTSTPLSWAYCDDHHRWFLSSLKWLYI